MPKHREKIMQINLKTIVAFVLGVLLSAAFTISADNTDEPSEIGRYQVATTGLGDVLIVWAVVIDTRTGKIVHKEKIKAGAFDFK